MTKIEALTRRLRLIDFAFAAVAAVALWALGLAELAWLPFTFLAMAPGPAARC